MKALTCLALLASLKAVSAHGGHGADADGGEEPRGYAARHMATEHHIDDFDLESFFHLHDLDRNLYWTPDEIEAIYGVHHEISKKHHTSADEEGHQQKASLIVSSVLAGMDKDKDGLVSLEEFIAAGPDGLPDFNALGADGHHYDSESEYFLHHEEIYHSTPETQTDEAYNHPEDIEHFANHEAIELEEENRERQFQGLPIVDEEGNPLPDEEQPHQEGEAQQVMQPPTEQERPKVRFDRNAKAQDPADIFAKAVEVAKETVEEYGEGDSGFKRPRTAAEKLRRNLPYKYKFRRSWSDF